MAVFALSIHADYRCRHSGACCSAGWDVPVELPVYRALSDAAAAGRLKPATVRGGLPFITGPDLPDDAAAMLARTPRGQCGFFDGASRLCAVHRDLGERALPSTCRSFPRLALRDARGTFITLSHFCPTAALALFREDVAVEIVEAPAAFPGGEYGGLVVQADDWPPLLHMGMLMDLAGYAAWERHMVARCADVARAPDSVVATLERDARVLRAWKPGGRSLADAVAALPQGGVDAAPPAALEESIRLHREAMRAVPRGLAPARDETGLKTAFGAFVAPRWNAYVAPLDRYLATKAFASWTAYQGRGVITIVRGIEAALAIVRVEAARQCRDAGRMLDAGLLREAFRRADYLLNHLAARDALASAWAREENRRRV